MLAQEDSIDLVIPRGGEGLIRFVTENSKIPVLKHYKGVCHIFVDRDADLNKAITDYSQCKNPTSWCLQCIGGAFDSPECTLQIRSCPLSAENCRLPELNCLAALNVPIWLRRYNLLQRMTGEKNFSI